MPTPRDGDDAGSETSGGRDGRTRTDSDRLRRALTARAGEVAATERRRALRAFDDDPEVRRALSTMAVRVAVGVVAPAVAAAEADDRTAETVADLFLGE